MDLLTTARVEKINELCEAVEKDSRRRHLSELAATPAREKSPILGLTEKEKRTFSFSRLAIRLYERLPGKGHVSGTSDGLEWECHKALEELYGPPSTGRSAYLPADVTHGQRALSSIPGSKGGYLISPDVVGFIDGLYNASVCLRLGAQNLLDQSTTVTFVKEKTGPTITWQASDGQSTTPADAVFAQISGSPHTAIAIHELSEQLLYQASPVTEAGLVRNLSLALGSAIDGVMLAGAGGAQPTGLLSAVGVNTVTGAAITRAVLLDMQQQPLNSNAVIHPDAQGYVGYPSVAALMAGRQEFSGSTLTQWQGTLARGTVCGAPAMATKGVGSGNLIFGDFSQLMLVNFSPIQLNVNSSDSRFNQALVAIRALAMVDVLVLEPKSFTIATSVT